MTSRLLFVISGSVLNRGMNTGIENLAYGLINAGFEVSVISCGKKPKKYDNERKIRYYFTDKKRQSPIDILNVYKEYREAIAPDLIIGWAKNLALLADLDKNAKLIVMQGQMSPKSLLLSILKDKFRFSISLKDWFNYYHSLSTLSSKVSAVVSISKAVEDDSLRCFRWPKYNRFIIPRGVSSEIFYPPDSQNRRTTNHLVLVYAGNMIKQKGLEDLFKALHFVSIPTEVRLCGKDANGYIDYLEEKYIDRNRCTVRKYGVLSSTQLAEVFRSSDVFIFLSHSEGLGKSLLEGMACGLAPLVSDLPVFKEIINDENEGIICKSGDINAYAAAITKFGKDYDYRLSCGINSSKVISEKFYQKQEINNWSRLINNL